MSLNTNTGRGLDMATGMPKAPKGYKRFQQYTPEAMQLYKQMFSQVNPESYLSRLAGGDEELYAQMEEPAMRQLSQLEGGLASRFSGMGLGARQGSGFKLQSGQLAADFAKDLQSQRLALRQQAIRELMGLSSDLLEKQPYGLVKKQYKPNWWQSLMSGFAPAIGAGVGGYYGGNKGAQTGLQAGSAFGEGLLM